MSAPKILIAFYSTYGTNHAVAETAAKAAEAAGAEVRLVRFAETAPAEVVAAQDAWKAQADRVAVDPRRLARRHGMGGRLFLVGPDPLRVGGEPGARLHRHARAALAQGQARQQDLHRDDERPERAWRTGDDDPVALHHRDALGRDLVRAGLYRSSVFDAGGNPYGYSANRGALDDTGKAAVAHQAKRLVEFTERSPLRRRSRRKPPSACGSDGPRAALGHQGLGHLPIAEPRGLGRHGGTRRGARRSAGSPAAHRRRQGEREGGEKAVACAGLADHRHPRGAAEMPRPSAWRAPIHPRRAR